MRTRSILRSLLAVALLGVATPAAADDPKPELDAAGRLYREGVKLVDAGNYPEAEAKFEQVWAIRPSHDVAVSLAQTEQKLGQHAAAAEHLDYAIRTTLASKSASYQAMLRDMLADAQTHCARIELVTGRGAVLTVNGAARGKADEQGVLVVHLEPGHHAVVASLGGREATASIEAAPGEHRKVPVPLPPAALPPPVPPNGTGASPFSPVVAGFGFGLGGAGIVAASVVTALASAEGRQADDLSADLKASHTACPEGAVTQACVDLSDADARRDVLSNAALGTWIGAGAILTAASIYTAVTLSTGAESPGAATVTADVSPGHGFISLRATFE